MKARILTTNIDFDEGTSSLKLVESASEFFGLTLGAALGIIREVGAAVGAWHDVAAAVGARPAEVSRMASAFKHDDLKRALAL